jgi:hypothetical protein
MTYLFIIAALPVMNATANNGEGWPELLIANSIVILTLLWLENEWGFTFESSRTVTYEKINLIHPDNQSLLMRDLEDRTGLNINRVEIGRINFLRDTARIKIYYDESDQPQSLEIPRESSTKPDNRLLYMQQKGNK